MLVCFMAGAHYPKYLSPDDPRHPMTITIKKMNETTFKVTVWDQTTTAHVGTVYPESWQKLTGGSISPETLVEKSFQFLLEREPNTSILAEFDLPKIQRYFPEYEDTIRTHIQGPITT